VHGTRMATLVFFIYLFVFLLSQASRMATGVVYLFIHFSFVSSICFVGVVVIVDRVVVVVVVVVAVDVCCCCCRSCC